MKCKQAEKDLYLSESICKKYGMICRVACISCKEPEWEDECK